MRLCCAALAAGLLLPGCTLVFETRSSAECSRDEGKGKDSCKAEAAIQRKSDPPQLLKD